MEPRLRFRDKLKKEIKQGIVAAAVGALVLCPLYYFTSKKPEPDRVKEEKPLVLDFVTLLELKEKSQKECHAIISSGVIARDLDSWSPNIVRNIEQIYLTPKIKTESMKKYEAQMPAEISYLIYHLSFIEGFSWANKGKWRVNVFFSSSENDSITLRHEIAHYIWGTLSAGDRSLVAGLLEKHAAGELNTVFSFVKRGYVDRKITLMKEELQKWRQNIEPYAKGEITNSTDWNFGGKVYSRSLYRGLIARIDLLLKLADSITQTKEPKQFRGGLEHFRKIAATVVPDLKKFCRSQIFCFDEKGISWFSRDIGDFYLGEMFARVVEAHFGNKEVPKVNEIEDVLGKLRFRGKLIFERGVAPYSKYPEIQCTLDRF